jgi:hypothetical protein
MLDIAIGISVMWPQTTASAGSLRLSVKTRLTNGSHVMIVVGSLQGVIFNDPSYLMTRLSTSSELNCGKLFLAK